MFCCPGSTLESLQGLLRNTGVWALLLGILIYLFLVQPPLLAIIGQEKEQKMYLQTIYERGRAGKWLNTQELTIIFRLSFQKQLFRSMRYEWNWLGSVEFPFTAWPCFSSFTLHSCTEKILFSIYLISMGELKGPSIIYLFFMKSSPISYYPLFVLI